MKVIIINGIATAGKDYFVKKISILNKETFSFSSVAKAKEIAEKYFKWNPNIKSDKDRKLLSDLKDLLTWYNDIPYKDIIEMILYLKQCCSFKNPVLFVHIREPKEIEKIKLYFKDKVEFKIYTLLLNAKERVKHIPDNHADQNVYDYNYDIVIENNGSKIDTDKKIKRFYNKYIKE